MLVVVTGGAGHLGTNLSLSLLRAGHDLRVVDLRDPVTARAGGATWVRGDVRDAGAMRAAFDGAGVVYHLAGVISVVGRLGGLVESVNVDGARVVAGAALATRVGRLVHCSSVHAYDLEAAGGAAVDETAPRATGRRHAAYDRSKAAGEQAVLETVQHGLDAVVVNPTGVIGALDEGPSRMGAVLRALLRRRMPAVVVGGFDWVDVTDVATAMISAAERGRTGESYLIPGHRKSMRELGDLCGAAPWVAPMWAARLGGPVATVVARRTQSPLMPTTEALTAVRCFPRIDGSKARRELGHAPRPIEQTITELAAFFRARGDLR